MKKMLICNNVDNNGVLRVRFLKLNVYSSSKARPLSLTQHVARDHAVKRALDCLLVDVAHSVTIVSRSCLKLLGWPSCGTFQIR